ncbi:MAG: hypothetical protein CFE44_04245 [Burkholderiales bacterium PBB4]|nr:MAG: hypothetical protein CFE44_04245 [Burkholderiales bacterium PBB4]
MPMPNTLSPTLADHRPERPPAFLLHKLMRAAYLGALTFLGMVLGASGAQASTPAIAAGTAHSLLLTTDGSVWVWGRNSQGQVGDGSGQARNRPVMVGNRVIAIAAGGDSSFALRADGSLWAWGDNQWGQLGDGTFQNRLGPVLVGTGFEAVSTNGKSTFATKRDGSNWAWGQNDNAQLGLPGDSAKVHQALPVAVGRFYAAASSGECHGAGVTPQGALWTWGCSSRYVGGTAGHFILGQRGNGHVNSNSFNDLNPPDFAPVVLAEGYRTVSTGVHYNLALKSDGSLWIFGSGDFRDVVAFKSLVPLQVGEDYTVAVQGAHFSAGLKKDGSLWTWGLNAAGQLADGGTGNTSCLFGEVFAFDSVACRPQPAPVGSGYAALAVGAKHGLALGRDGTVWAWGSNDEGQLGDGSHATRTTPVALSVQVGSAVLGPRLVRSVPVADAPALAALPFFDLNYYLLRNPDVAKAFAGDTAAARTHWLQTGSAELREASVLFDAQWYLQHHTDVALALGNDGVGTALHYRDFGVREGRSASPAFSVAYYRAAYPNLQAAFGENTALYQQHYLAWGATECRRASPYFDPQYYLHVHPDVAGAVRNDCAAALVHWLHHGRAEGRVAAPDTAPLYPR